MRIPFLVLVPLIWGAASLAEAASRVDEAARLLDGAWRGEDYALTIDSRRAQANVDPGKPFQWQRFVVKDVDDEAIIFAIGAEIFEARIAGDVLELSSTSFRGERRLTREQAVDAIGDSEPELRAMTE
jgi:hypothetical protein